MALYICILFSDILCSDMSLLLLTVTMRGGGGVSNKHCLLPLFSVYAFLKCLLWLAETKGQTYTPEHYDFSRVAHCIPRSRKNEILWTSNSSCK